MRARKAQHCRDGNGQTEPEARNPHDPLAFPPPHIDRPSGTSIQVTESADHASGLAALCSHVHLIEKTECWSPVTVLIDAAAVSVGWVNDG
jgi:hypothetical protein